MSVCACVCVCVCVCVNCRVNYTKMKITLIPHFIKCIYQNCMKIS